MVYRGISSVSVCPKCNFLPHYVQFLSQRYFVLKLDRAALVFVINVHISSYKMKKMKISENTKFQKNLDDAFLKLLH